MTTTVSKDILQFLIILQILWSNTLLASVIYAVHFKLSAFSTSLRPVHSLWVFVFPVYVHNTVCTNFLNTSPLCFILAVLARPTLITMNGILIAVLNFFNYYFYFSQIMLPELNDYAVERITLSCW